MLARLLSECQSISSSIEKLVNAVREKKVQEEGGEGREGGREGGRLRLILHLVQTVP